MFIGARIRQLRESKGWSSGELSENSGISRAYLWQLETGGKDRPSIDVLEKLASALGVYVSDFSDVEPEEDNVGAAEVLPQGLVDFVRNRGQALGVTKGDMDVMKKIHFRGQQPGKAEDWELLWLFLQKWARD